MDRLKSKTGKVHIKYNEHGTLCNSFFRLMNPESTRSEEPVTCQTCLKILNKSNLNKKDSLILAESFISAPEKPFRLIISFSKKRKRLKKVGFDTKAERNAYVRGVKDAVGRGKVKIKRRVK